MVLHGRFLHQSTSLYQNGIYHVEGIRPSAQILIALLCCSCPRGAEGDFLHLCLSSDLIVYFYLSFGYREKSILIAVFRGFLQ